ncbi:MAG TPA: CoA-transferase, partial [Chloroflexota bacterium]|nr:CoA-transferase [Chloroflexota bacterium]
MKAGDFRDARRRIEAKRRPSGERLMSAAGAARLVKDGDQVIIGGCMFSRTPMAILHELLRHGRRDLVISRNLS